MPRARAGCKDVLNRPLDISGGAVGVVRDLVVDKSFVKSKGSNNIKVPLKVVSIRPQHLEEHCLLPANVQGLVPLFVVSGRVVTCCFEVSGDDALKSASKYVFFDLLGIAIAVEVDLDWLACG